MKLTVEVDGVGELVELFDIFRNHFFNPINLADDVRVDIKPESHPNCDLCTRGYYDGECDSPACPFRKEPLLRKDGKPFTGTTEDMDVERG